MSTCIFRIQDDPGANPGEPCHFYVLKYFFQEMSSTLKYLLDTPLQIVIKGCSPSLTIVLQTPGEFYKEFSDL